jgi:hypothetical protein
MLLCIYYLSDVNWLLLSHLIPSRSSYLFYLYLDLQTLALIMARLGKVSEKIKIIIIIILKFNSRADLEKNPGYKLVRRINLK